MSRAVLQVTQASTLELVTGSAPAVKLDDKHYKLVDKVCPCPFRSGAVVQATGAPAAGGFSVRTLTLILSVLCKQQCCAAKDARVVPRALLRDGVQMEALTLAAPSLVAAKSLTVKGPVKFPPGVFIKGDVTFINGAVLPHPPPC